MGLYRLLHDPVVYNLKTGILSLGRRSVRAYLRTQADLPATGRVLDIACGTGGHADAFSGAFWGVDLNARYVAYAKAYHKGRFLVMDATNLAFPSNHFDLVFCVGLCHHLADQDVRAAAREMKRVTRNGGRVLIIDGVFPPKTNPLGHVLFTFDRGEHTRTLGALSRLLAAEEFPLVSANIRGSFPYRRAVFSYQK